MTVTVTTNDDDDDTAESPGQGFSTWFMVFTLFRWFVKMVSKSLEIELD